MVLLPLPFSSSEFIIPLNLSVSLEMQTTLVHSLWPAILVFLLGKSSNSIPSFHGNPVGSLTSQAGMNWPDEARSQQQVSYLLAKEFQFEIWDEYPAVSQSKRKRSIEVIRHDQNGSLDLMLIPQGVGIKVVMQISQSLRENCRPQPDQACAQQGAAPARGNVAELQWSLPSHLLKPGIYRLGKGGSTPQTEVITHWRRLASDLPEGQPGCPRWGEATLRIQRADVDASGKLALLQGTLTRVCEQSLSDPPSTRVEQLGQRKTVSPGRYVLHASWWSRLAESPR